MFRRRMNRSRTGLALVLAALMGVAGCGKPTEETRQNRRVVDGLLTAVTTKNRKELEKCKGLLDKRQADGHLSKANVDELRAAFEQATAGKWSEAEEALYKFRESKPFPK